VPTKVKTGQSNRESGEQVSEEDSDEEGESDYGHVDSTDRDGDAHYLEEQEVTEVVEDSEVEAQQEQLSEVTGVKETQDQDLGTPEVLPEGDDEDEVLYLCCGVTGRNLFQRGGS